MPDIILDIPLAYTVLERFVEKCSKAGFIPDDVTKKVPMTMRWLHTFHFIVICYFICILFYSYKRAKNYLNCKLNLHTWLKRLKIRCKKLVILCLKRGTWKVWPTTRLRLVVLRVRHSLIRGFDLLFFMFLFFETGSLTQGQDWNIIFSSKSLVYNLRALLYCDKIADTTRFRKYHFGWILEFRFLQIVCLYLQLSFVLHNLNFNVWHFSSWE